MMCAHCGIEVDDAARFCPTCGRELNGLAQTELLPAQAAPSEWEIVSAALWDEYEMRTELGRGGMAIVYKARERMLDRDVAVKVLPSALTFDADFVERFEREARTAARLEHPNIIPIYRVGRSGQVIYFVMKYLRGGSLASRLERRGKLSPHEVRPILIAAATALGYAHRHHVVHRDIKPDNIMFDESGHAVVTDFGIAKAASCARLTGTGMSIGTPLYMSPEQARAKPLDGRADLYSLGIVTYQCLTGCVPFDGEDPLAIGLKHIMEAVPVPALPTGEHRALFAVIERMVAKQPADRYQTAEELLAELECGVQSSDVWVAAPTIVLPPQPTDTANGSVGVAHLASSSVPAAEAPRHTSSRSWGKVAALAAALVLAAGGVGYWYVGLGAPWPPALGVPAQPNSPTNETPAGMPVTPAVVAMLDSVAENRSLTPGATGSTNPATTDSAMSAAAASGNAAVDSAPARDSSLVAARDSTAAVPTPVPSGVLVLEGLPRTARLSVDGESKMGLTHDVDAGDRLIEVSARGYRDFSKTVSVAGGDTVPVQVAMVRLPQPAVVDPCSTTPPVPEYFSTGRCYDTRPSPRRPPLVYVYGDLPAEPSPVQLLVKVSREGRPLQILRARRQTAEAGLILRAIGFVRDSLRFVAASKAGSPIEAWARLTVQFRPAR